MRWLLYATIFLLVGCSHNVVVPPPPTAPSFTWTNNGNPGVANCSAVTTTPVECITTYTLTDTTQPGAPVVISSSISANALSYVMSTLPQTGIHVYQLTINGVDQSGNPVISPPAQTTITIP